MPFNNPRTFEYLVEGIGWSLSNQELERLQEFARAHYTGAALDALETAIASRREVLKSLDWRARGPHPLSASLRHPFERMMDDIAGAMSVAEVDHLRAEVRALFETPERDQLEKVLDGKKHTMLRAGSGDGQARP